MPKYRVRAVRRGVNETVLEAENQVVPKSLSCPNCGCDDPERLDYRAWLGGSFVADVMGGPDGEQPYPEGVPELIEYLESSIGGEHPGLSEDVMVECAACGETTDLNQVRREAQRAQAGTGEEANDPEVP